MAEQEQTIRLTVYACTDIACIKAGHPDHLGTVAEHPDGTVTVSRYGECCGNCDVGGTVARKLARCSAGLRQYQASYKREGPG